MEEGMYPCDGMFEHIPNLLELHLNGAFSLEIEETARLAIDELPNNIFRGLSKLKGLYLRDNELTDIHPDLFQNLEELEYLDLSGNTISNIKKEVFQNLPSLKGFRVDSKILDHKTLKLLNQISKEEFQDYYRF